MFDRKEFKRKGKAAFKLNYLACVAVCFIMVFLGGEYSTTIQGMSSWDSANVADLKYNPAQKKEIIMDMVKYNLTPEETNQKWKVDNVDAVKKWWKSYNDYGIEGLNSKEVTFFGTTGDGSNIETVLNAFSATRSAKQQLEQLTNNSIVEKMPATAINYVDGLTKTKSYNFTFVASIVSIFSEKKSLNETLVVIGNFIFSLLMAVFVTNTLVVCERRFFLESRTYRRTKVGRMGFLFRERTLHPLKTMFVKDMMLLGWSFTIAGFFIKTYSYAMVPYIMAENPNMKSRKAITLSREMMNGHKWELFVLDMSMMGWVILSMLTFGLVGIFFTNPYKTAVTAEVYIALRREAIEKKLAYSEELNDKYLDLDLLEKQIEQKAEKDGMNPDLAGVETVFSIRIPDKAGEEYLPTAKDKEEITL